jgi:ferredoxin
MNNLAYNTKRKNSNNLIDNMLEFDRNTKHLKDTVEWYYNDETGLDFYKNSEDWTVLEDCFYITEFHQIALKKSLIGGGKTVFVLHLNKILNSTNDFFKIIPSTQLNNYMIISLDQFKADYKLIFFVFNPDIQFIKDLQLRKLNYCIECNDCAKVCPINSLQNSFSPIQFIKNEVIKTGYVQNQLCTGCSKCNSVCPVGIELSDYFLFYNKPKNWNEKLLTKALNYKFLAPYVFKYIK